METKDMIKLLNERGHYAREVGCEVLGVPDIVACVSGWFVAIENKRTGGCVVSCKKPIVSRSCTITDLLLSILRRAT